MVSSLRMAHPSSALVERSHGQSARAFLRYGYAAFVVELKARIQMVRDLPVSDTPYAAVVRNSAVIEILGLTMGRLH
jgi:hypothetical protein